MGAGWEGGRQVLGDGTSPRARAQPASGLREEAQGACLGTSEADWGLLSHCYGFKGQWGIVVSGDPIVCFRCRSQPRSGWRFPEGQAGSVCGTLNNEAGMFPSHPLLATLPQKARRIAACVCPHRPGHDTAQHGQGHQDHPAEQGAKKKKKNKKKIPIPAFRRGIHQAPLTELLRGPGCPSHTAFLLPSWECLGVSLHPQEMGEGERCLLAACSIP